MISRLGRFEIQAEIGRGGFGQVFRAFDPVMNRVVAVKILTATEDANSFNRFKNEATAAGNLRHENIVTVYEFGQEGQTPYLVMEYLNGEDLQQIIKNNSPMSLFQKLRVMDQVADGLHCAHRNGVLHRDVKPANIMVLQNNVAKIMDFGIARLTRDTSTRLTQQGYLIGTVVYMAPELFAGTEVDALCDIWSYGVILYELLAGKNPFQIGSVQAEMYRICNQDVEPLPSNICPPDLQVVVNKLLSRQRDFRYQTLEDTRFDLQPILKNLEKAEADRLLASAQQLVFQQKWDEALNVAREARRMDPQNGTARIIFERAQTELQRLSLRPRIDDLLRRSQDIAEQRKFDEAIDLLDKARKLDTTNERVLSRIQELRVLKQRLDEAAKLLAEADKEFRSNRLNDAFEHASDGVALDPDNEEAKRLLERIRGEIQAREIERAAGTEIRRARGLMAVDDLDGAVEALKKAEANYPGRAETRELQTRLSQLIAERERRRDFSKRLLQAKDAVRGARYGDAVDELEELLKLFPNEVEATDLLAYARQELKAKQRSEEIRQMIDSAAELAQAQRFDEAIRILEAGLKKFPDDLPLTRQLRSIHADKQAFERERALQDGLRRCEGLRRRQEWPEAIELVAKLRAEYQNSRELTELEAAIRQESSEAERTEALRNALEQAEQLLQSGQPDHASMVLESAILGLGAQRELTALLEKVQEAQRAARERQYIQSELKHATTFEQRGDFTTSLKIIEDALLRSPKSQELLAARDRLSNDRERAQRDRMVSAEAAAVQEALNRKEWPEAIAKLEQATKLFPAETVFSRLDEELRRRKRDDLREKLAEGRRLLNAGQVQDAEAFVSANLLMHREDPEVMSLGRDIVAEKRRRERVREEDAQRAAFVAECSGAAKACEQKGDLAGALSRLDKGLERYPKDPDLAGAQQRVSELLAATRKRQLLAAVQQALDGSNWSQALQFIEEVRQQYPNDPALIRLQAAALDQRRTFLESASAAIRSKLGENKIDDARILFDQNLARHQDQAIVKAAAAEIASAEAQREAKNKADEQKRAFLSENLQRAVECEQADDYPRAIATIQKALKKYPGDPELAATLNRLQSTMEKAERDRSLAATVAGIKRDLDRGSLEDALRRLDEVRVTFPDSAELKNLEQQARKRREREIQSLVEKARSSLGLGNPAEAERILTKNLAPYAGEPAVVALAEAIKGARAREGEQKVRENLIQTARTHTAARRFTEAEAAINELAAHYPGDPEEARLRSALEAAREQERKEKLYRTGRAEGDQLLRSRKYADAIAKFEYLLTQFPDDSQLQNDLKGAQAAETRTQSGMRQGLPAQPVLSAEPGLPQPPKSRGPLYGIAAVVLAGVAGVAYWMWPAPEKTKDHVVVENPSHTTDNDNGKGKGKDKGTVEPPPLDVQPAVLRFQYKPGSPAPQPQKITVKSSAVVADPAKSAPWLTFTRHDAGSGETEFVVQIRTDQLPRGKDTFNDDLIFSAEKKVHVEVVAAVQEFEVRPLELSFHYQHGSPPPQAQAITVFSSSEVANPGKKLAWLNVARRRAGEGRTEFLVQPSPPENLDAGNYSDDLIFPRQKTVHVSIVVQPKPVPPPPVVSIDVQPASLRFVYRRGGTPPQTQNFLVTGPTNVTDPKKSAPWIHLTHNTTGTKTEFVVQVVPEGLDRDEYADDLIFSPQKKVHVELMIKETPDRFPPAHGDTTWSGGTLNAGDELAIKGSRVVKGPGHMDRKLPFADIVVNRAKLPPGVHVLDDPADANNFTLRLRNDSTGPVYELPIYWDLKK